MSEIEERLMLLNKKLKRFYNIIKKTQNLRLLETLPKALTSFLFLLNIKVINGTKNEEFSLFITKDVQKFFRGYSAASDFTIIGPKDIWIDILDGKRSLFGEIIKKNLEVHNIRVNWLKTLLFSQVIWILTNSNLLELHS
ncbi:MAG: hypothetical protein ACTSRW_01015 [Candidatus Helarchaeota archaeon]